MVGFTTRPLDITPNFKLYNYPKHKMTDYLTIMLNRVRGMKSAVTIIMTIIRLLLLLLESKEA